MIAVRTETTRIPYGIWKSRSALVKIVNPPLLVPMRWMTDTPTWLITT